MNIKEIEEKVNSLIHKFIWTPIKWFFIVILVLSLSFILLGEISSDLVLMWGSDSIKDLDLTSPTIFGVGLALIAPLLFTPKDLNSIHKKVIRTYLGYSLSFAYFGLVYLQGSESSPYPTWFIDILIILSFINIFSLLIYGTWNLFFGLIDLFKIIEE